MTQTQTQTYYRVGPIFWRTAARKGWDNDTKLVALYVLTSPHRVTEGLFSLPAEYVVADTGITKPKVGKALARLEADEFIERDGDYVLIINALVWQAPRAKSNAVHAVSQVRGLRTSLLGRLLALAIEHCSLFAEQLLLAMPDLRPVHSRQLSTDQSNPLTQTNGRPKGRSSPAPALTSSRTYLPGDLQGGGER